MNFRDSRSFGLICACIGALGFSFKAIFIKAAYEYHVDAETLLALRMGYSLPFFAAMGISIEMRKPMRMNRRDVGMLLLLGLVGYYAASYLDFLGLQYITAALERLILFLYPTLVLVLSALVLRKPIKRNMLWPLAMCYVGIVLAVTHDAQLGGRDVTLGCVLVFLSALAYAIYLMLSGPAIQRLGSTRVAAYATGAACLFSLIQFLLLRSPDALQQPWQVHALSIAMAVFSTALPIWLVAESIRILGTAQASMISTLGPIFTILLAVLLLGESFEITQAIGAALVIGGVWWVAKMKT
ncbi:MAG: DMT family transporter [Steroidobacteraceae bacterium]